MSAPLAYDRQTVESSNPLVRYAHRSQLRRTCALVRRLPEVRRLLDYGCGSGEFLGAPADIPGLLAVGYGPC